MRPARSPSAWEDKWARAGFAPRRDAAFPDVIRLVVEQGWFPRRASVLDVGCGLGEIAAWLAREGYEVTGIDFAPSAIARAEAAHADVERLTFEVADICRQPPPGGPFDALLDCGCLQGIPSEDRPSYMRHVAAVARPGARFLILHRIRPELGTQAIEDEVRTLSQDAFEVVDVAETVMARDRRNRRRIPGLAFRLARRP